MTSKTAIIAPPVPCAIQRSGAPVIEPRMAILTRTTRSRSPAPAVFLARQLIFPRAGQQERTRWRPWANPVEPRNSKQTECVLCNRAEAEGV